MSCLLNETIDADLEEKRERGGETRIKVYAFKVGWQGIVEIEDTQKAKEDFVGGPLEEIQITDGFIAICNEDAFIKELEVTAMLLGDGNNDCEAIDERGINYVMQGNFLVCRADSDGKLISIADEDVKTIRHYLKTVNRVGDAVLQIE